MATYRVNKTRDFTTMSNYHLKDKNLSLKAKGLLSVMLSLDDEWKYSVDGLCSISKENKTAINSTLKELKDNNYLVVSKYRKANGTFEYVYDIYEQPQTDKPNTDKPDMENLAMDNPYTENHPLNKYTNNINTNNKILNNNILEENIKRIFNFWNEQKIIVHTKISAEIKESIKKALNKYSLDEIETAILHYSMALKSTYKYCEYTWSLTQFLKQKNALQDFLDDGSKWINYLKWKNEYQVENKPDKVYDEFLKDDLGDD